MGAMRAGRLLSLLLLLQHRGRMTAPEIAAELEVSVRTVYRDVEALGASGVPVYADRGPAGGYRLLDGYRTRLTGLTGDEADSLFLAGMPGPAAELGLGADLATAQLKLRAALPAGLEERSRRIQERFHLDAPGWFRDAEPVPHLAAAAEAVWERRVLRVHYRRWRGEVRRDLHGLGLVLKGGIWYLVARAEDSVRSYRVSRILAAEVLDEHFERPAGFDLAAHWQETSRRLESSRFQGEAELLLTERGRKLLPMQFGGVGAVAAAGAGPPDEEGRVRVTLPVESLPVAVHDVLRLGTEAEVLGPPELRDAVARAVTELARRYRPSD
ncbi:WYL domain-containing protein [Streptomyces sp. NA02950]|uniref:helix-turn-helix transcriptional regulator n=1 Tax=Streptomyces sp. NA02950 TaxID=2742137 RepID=UPI00158FB339|nr:WYL domain-containing protein [Streptomyces sp. NA02950]QKV91269.1 WYL domain-containing protein [Streptomyces sp. NA02950]